MDKHQTMSDEEFVILCEENLYQYDILRIRGFGYTDDDIIERLLNIVKKYEKALDKACEKLVAIRKSSSCFSECPFRYGDCIVGESNKCFVKEYWKEWLMKNG